MNRVEMAGRVFSVYWGFGPKESVDPKAEFGGETLCSLG